jgi:hypothetical protein
MSNLRKSFNVGQVVKLDKDHANGSEVTVVRQTPQKLFTTVTSNGENNWDVMTNRLSEI